jgi:hypothetical protein
MRSLEQLIVAKRIRVSTFHSFKSNSATVDIVKNC